MNIIYRMEKLKTIEDIADLGYADVDYKYQPTLTKILDDSHNRVADQNLINEIVLWKTNRYAQMDEKTLELLNHPKIYADVLDVEFTRDLLARLLATNGIRLPMASTILRFRNPNIYQIIDQRAYRFSIGIEFNLTAKDEVQVDLYLEYLNRLQDISSARNIPFNEVDRILHVLDKKYNDNVKIKS